MPAHGSARLRTLAICLAIAALLGAAPAISDDADGWSIGTRPDWVEPIEPFSAAPSPVIEGERPRGIDVRLFERQIDLRGGGTSSWQVTERAFLTRDGVEDHARHEITFDPLYQRLTLHEVTLLRGDRVLDRLEEGLDIRLLDTEPERGAALYGGRHTLSLLIEDVRVGDMLRADVRVEDADAMTTLELLGVGSSEPDASGGTTDDIVIVDQSSFRLRRERSTRGDGRVYTIAYRATDGCGNASDVEATVTVPRSLGRR